MTPAAPSATTPDLAARPPRLLALPTVRNLAALLVINATGNGLFLAISTLWFTRGLGYSAERVGLTLTVAGLCGVLAAFPAGRSCDRYGAKRVLVVLHLGQATAMTGYCVAGSYGWFLALTCLVAAAGQANGAARAALYAYSLDPAVRTRALGLLRAVNNVGIGVGAALGSAVLVLDSHRLYRVAILVNAATFVLALIPLRAVTVRRSPTRHLPIARPAAPRGSTGALLRDVPYLAVTALNAIVNLLYVVLEVALPLWLLDHTSAPPVVVGWLLVLNPALVVALQLRAARDAADLPAAARSFRRGGLLVAASCLVAAGAAHGAPVAATAALLAAVVLLTLGEVTSQAGSWTLGYALAPDHAPGAYQGVYHTGISVTQALGPGLVTVLVLTHGGPGWGALAVLFAAAALALPGTARWAARRLPPTG